MNQWKSEKEEKEKNAESFGCTGHDCCCSSISQSCWITHLNIRTYIRVNTHFTKSRFQEETGQFAAIFAGFSSRENGNSDLMHMRNAILCILSLWSLTDNYSVTELFTVWLFIRREKFPKVLLVNLAGLFSARVFVKVCVYSISVKYYSAECCKRTGFTFH